MNPNVNGRTTFNQTRHLPVNVISRRSHPFNTLKIDLFGIYGVGCEERIGGVLFHIHDIIKGSPLAKDFDLLGAHEVLGRLALTLTFTYGPFGYGMSRQLYLDEDGVVGEAGEEGERNLEYSLFPRITPDYEECETNGYIIKTLAVPHPDFIPFQDKVHLSYGKELKARLETLGKGLEHRSYFENSIQKLEAVRIKASGLLLTVFFFHLR